MPEPTCPRCGRRLTPARDGTPPTCPDCHVRYPSDAETKTSLGDPPPAASIDYSGRSFGKYEIIEEVSRGAMGVVYKAREPVSQRVVALKVLLAGELASGQQVERFRREVQAAARLRHECIVPIHDVGVFDEKQYYTMDFIEGRPLSDMISAGELSIRRGLEIIADLAEALDYAHGEGVIHRDIKPSNVIVDPLGRPHLMDFGLAKLVDSDERFTATGTTVGTPSYMPPEQATGESKHVDHRADIYALGAVLYEMLTGRPPFSGETMVDTLMQVLHDEPVPPKRLNSRIHHDVQTIVLKAMEKKANRRYLTARALAEDIRHFIAGESIVARPASLGYRTWKWVKKHRSAALAAAAVLIVALTAVASIQQLRREAVERVEEAREEGKREGAKDLEAKIKEEERPTRKVMFADDFQRRSPGADWVVETGSWTVADDRLHGGARRPAAIHTRKRFTGNVSVVFDFRIPLAEEAPGGSAGRVGCFLGSDWRHSYRVTLGTGERSRLALMNQEEELASVECSPLEPETTYRVYLRRTSLGLAVSVEEPGRAQRHELRYNEVRLPRHLGREFAAGLFTDGARLGVERLRVEQEFLAQKASALRAPEELFRLGNFFEARNLYEQIAEGYEGRYEGAAALLGIALCEEVQGRYDTALERLRQLEAAAKGIEHERLGELLSRARLRRFFCSVALGEFADAAAALEQVSGGQGQVDPAWAWHFPEQVAELIKNGVYDEALAVLRAGIFGEAGQRLYTTAASLNAPMLQSTLASRARELAEAYCDAGESGQVREVYAAYPTPILADAFARAVEDARGRDREEALALLALCSENKMASPRLTQAAMNLGSDLCDAELYPRLSELYAAFPHAQLASVFHRAIREATAANRLDQALALLKESAENFPGRLVSLVGDSGPALRLGRALVARDDLLAPLELHRALGEAAAEPSFTSLFVEAAQSAVDSDRADDALRLLAHCREQFGTDSAGLSAVAVRLVGRFAEQRAYDRVVTVHQAYPGEALAGPLADALADAVAARRLEDALAILTACGRSGYVLPRATVRTLADALAALDPATEQTRAQLERYQRAQELYEAPAARTTLSLALGDALLGVGRLLPALAQYEAASGFQGALRAGCVAAELELNERAFALWDDLRRAAAEGAPEATIGAFLLGEAGTGDLERAAEAVGLGPGAAAYLRGLRLWMTDASGYAQDFATAARARPAWFTPLARRERGTSTEPTALPPETPEP